MLVRLVTYGTFDRGANFLYDEWQSRRFSSSRCGDWLSSSWYESEENTSSSLLCCGWCRECSKLRGKLVVCLSSTTLDSFKAAQPTVPSVSIVCVFSWKDTCLAARTSATSPCVDEDTDKVDIVVSVAIICDYQAAYSTGALFAIVTLNPRMIISNNCTTIVALFHFKGYCLVRALLFTFCDAPAQNFELLRTTCR